ncbi:siderophore-interacting protein [Corynebacterium freneyi]|uniref:siderophore-interacting protein n=1 Tax=Corynebacterium freneyi TaxID=134034 RepID=UPI0025516639|nr:siderophore-interacting protein [Corynebacterium freneyi]MDK8767268.1 siderophore-interacting protein [Corynebacterium freneyi]
MLRDIITASSSDLAPFRLFRTTVTTIDRSRPNIVRVTFGGDCLRRFGRGGLDQRIKLFFPRIDDVTGRALPLPDLGPDLFDADGAGEDTAYARLRAIKSAPDAPHVRTYTVRRIDPDGTALDVDLVAHGTTSPSARWLAQVRPGDPLTILGPDELSAGRLGGIEWRPGAASSILIAGDETALPAIAGIVEQGGVPANARVRIVVEAPDLRDLDDLRTPAEWNVVRLARPDDIAPGELLSDAVRALLADEPGFLGQETAGHDGSDDVDADAGDVVWDLAADHLDGGGYAWLAGEASAVTGLRRHLVRDLGVDKSRVSFMGYWRAGREGA